MVLILFVMAPSIVFADITDPFSPLNPVSPISPMNPLSPTSPLWVGNSGDEDEEEPDYDFEERRLLKCTQGLELVGLKASDQLMIHWSQLQLGPLKPGKYYIEIRVCQFKNNCASDGEGQTIAMTKTIEVSSTDVVQDLDEGNVTVIPIGCAAEKFQNPKPTFALALMKSINYWPDRQIAVSTLKLEDLKRDEYTSSIMELHYQKPGYGDGLFTLDLAEIGLGIH